MAKQRPSSKPRSTSRRNALGRHAAAGIASGEDPDPTWSALVDKYPDRRSLLEQESLYALPQALLELLINRLPEVFSEDDYRFEQDLTQVAVCGFFQRRPFSYAPLAVADSSVAADGAAAASDELTAACSAATQRLLEMLFEDAQQRGASEPQLLADLAQAQHDDKIAQAWRWAYAGWLATSSGFRDHRDALRRQSLEGVSASPPALPLTLTGRSGPDYWSPADIQRWQPFYNTWGIEGFATWDLPIPMRPQLSWPNLCDMSLVSQAGVTVFLPWYLIRHRAFKLNDLVDAVQRMLMPRELSDWINSPDGSWGSLRCLTMLRLYAWLELALSGRYRHKLYRQVARLDGILAEFLSTLPHSVTENERNVTLVRRQLHKRLNRHHQGA